MHIVGMGTGEKAAGQAALRLIIWVVLNPLRLVGRSSRKLLQKLFHALAGQQSVDLFN